MCAEYASEHNIFKCSCSISAAATGRGVVLSTVSLLLYFPFLTFKVTCLVPKQMLP